MKTATTQFGIILIMFLIMSCNNNKWEYKVVGYIDSESARIGSKSVKPISISPSESDLNSYGEEGWELVSSYLEMETAFPNFGNEDYVTGIRPNIRPQRVVLIFKRRI